MVANHALCAGEVSREKGKEACYKKSRKKNREIMEAIHIPYTT